MEQKYKKLHSEFSQITGRLQWDIDGQIAQMEVILRRLSDPKSYPLEQQRWNKKALENLLQQKKLDCAILSEEQGPIKSFKKLFEKIHPYSLDSLSSQRQQDLSYAP